MHFKCHKHIFRPAVFKYSQVALLHIVLSLCAITHLGVNITKSIYKQVYKMCLLVGEECTPNQIVFDPGLMPFIIYAKHNVQSLNCEYQLKHCTAANAMGKIAGIKVGLQHLGAQQSLHISLNYTNNWKFNLHALLLWFIYKNLYQQQPYLSWGFHCVS